MCCFDNNEIRDDSSKGLQTFVGVRTTQFNENTRRVISKVKNTVFQILLSQSELLQQLQLLDEEIQERCWKNDDNNNKVDKLFFGIIDTKA